jgi:DNA-binding response OmpR family regulator
MGRVLIADDEQKILEVMKDILETQGHQVVAVSDGETALRWLRSDHFDVALIDVMMPKVDGYHVAASVRALDKPPKIVIVTARDFNTDKGAVQASGADAFLPKPFSTKDLIDVVKNLISEKSKK